MNFNDDEETRFIEVSDIIDTLSNAESYISDAVSDLEDMDSAAEETRTHLNSCIKIIKALLGAYNGLFDADDPDELLQLIQTGKQLGVTSLPLAYALGYKHAVESRSDHYYINMVRAMIREQEDKEKQNAEAN